MLKRIFFTITVLFVLHPVYAQVNHDIMLGFLQIKDQHNLGMVFNGIHVMYRYGALWKIGNHEIAYQPKLGLGAVFTHGMSGFQALTIAPVNATWTISIYEQNGRSIRAGTNLAADYSYQLYPFLHNGHLFWATETGISGVVQYSRKWESRHVAVCLKNSLFGFTSHTQKHDPHFFSLQAKDWVAKAHEKMKFGSYDTYNHTTISFEYVPDIAQKHSFLYEFDYFGSFYGMKFFRINHNLIWRIAR